MAANRVDVEVAVQMHVAGRRISALLKAGMREPIEHHVVVRPHQSLDDAVTGRPAGRVQDRVLETEKLGDCLLEAQRIFCVARQRRRSGAVNAVFIDDRLGDLFDFGVGRQTEVILRGEIQSGEPQSAIVARGGDGERRLLRRFGIRPEAVAAAQALPFVKITDAGDQVLAAQFAKVPHAAG
jgi:hypothetical protein